jgi:hypothetical protein
VSNSNTPQTISKQVNRLISKLNLKAPPVYVKVQPEPWAIVNECFPNVERKVLSNGGKMLCGWQIWEWPNVMIEAEFHAIWQNPKGDWVDITPKQDEEQTILFAHTPKKAPLQPQEIWSIRTRLEIAKNTRELALLNLGIDSKLRGFDLVLLMVSDVMRYGEVLARTSIVQHIKGRQFSLK